MNEVSMLPKPISRAEEKAEKKKAKESHRRKVYRDVSVRDQYRCRHCKRSQARMHHHHIRFLSRGGHDHTNNIVLLCGICHANVHAYRLFIVGNADEDLQFTQFAMPPR